MPFVHRLSCFSCRQLLLGISRQLVRNHRVIRIICRNLLNAAISSVILAMSSSMLAIWSVITAVASFLASAKLLSDCVSHPSNHLEPLSKRPLRAFSSAVPASACFCTSANVLASQSPSVVLRSSVKASGRLSIVVAHLLAYYPPISWSLGLLSATSCNWSTISVIDLTSSVIAATLSCNDSLAAVFASAKFLSDCVWASDILARLRLGQYHPLSLLQSPYLAQPSSPAGVSSHFNGCLLISYAVDKASWASANLLLGIGQLVCNRCVVRIIETDYPSNFGNIIINLINVCR